MYKVLLVEDEEKTADYVKQALELEKMYVDVAFDGEEGLTFFKKGDYDIIVLDLEMPKLSGENLLIKIRDIDPYIDIIVYTNYAEFGDIKKLVNLGINGYINKGGEADLEELIQMIKCKLEPFDDLTMLNLINSTEEIKVD